MTDKDVIVRALRYLHGRLEDFSYSESEALLAIGLSNWYEEWKRDRNLMELSEFNVCVRKYVMAYRAARELWDDTPESIRSLVKDHLYSSRKELVAALIENSSYLDRNLTTVFMELEKSYG